MTRAWLIGIGIGAGLAAGACDEGTRDKAKGTIAKADEAVGKAVGKLDADEAAAQLASAKDALARGAHPAEACSWLAAQPAGEPPEAARAAVTALRGLCTVDAPLAKATAAVARAEKARAEQPEAPSLTECQSDDWAAAKASVPGTPAASDPRWGELQARWAKACP